MSLEKLSLRPGEWGDRSWKLPILGSGSGWTVLDQPALTSAKGARSSPATLALQEALRKRIREHRPSIRALFPDGATAIYPLDCGGPVIFAGSREQLAALRENYGSNRWQFRFLILARGGPREDEVSCDLPIALHSREDRSLVSHTTGKRATTRFRRLAANSGLQLWEAETNFLRSDQIRLHASEVGLRIAGENRYGQEAPLSRADLPGKRRPGGRSFILFPAPALHLSRLVIPLLGQTFPSDPPKALSKWIGFQRSGGPVS